MMIIKIIRFSQVDLVGVVAANSTVGAEELISWACDQYLGRKPLSSYSHHYHYQYLGNTYIITVIMMIVITQIT